MSSLPDATPPTKKLNRGLIVPIIAIIIIGLLAGVSAFSYIQSNNTISSYRQDIGVQSTSIVNLNGEVSSESNEISSQNGKISSQSNEISFQNNVASSQSNDISAQNRSISVLTGQVSALRSINNLTISQNEVISQSYRTGSGGNATVDSFSINYAGYILVSMTFASDYAHEGISLLNVFSSTVNSPYYNEIIVPGIGLFYTFSKASDGFVIPVVPGTVTVYLETSDNSSQSATLSVTYYY